MWPFLSFDILSLILRISSMISKCSVKTINKVHSKAAIIFFLTHLAPQQNFYMWIPSGENEMGSKDK